MSGKIELVNGMVGKGEMVRWINPNKFITKEGKANQKQHIKQFGLGPFMVQDAEISGNGEQGVIHFYSHLTGQIQSRCAQWFEKV